MKENLRSATSFPSHSCHLHPLALQLKVPLASFRDRSTTSEQRTWYTFRKSQVHLPVSSFSIPPSPACDLLLSCSVYPLRAWRLPSFNAACALCVWCSSRRLAGASRTWQWGLWWLLQLWSSAEGKKRRILWKLKSHKQKICSNWFCTTYCISL